MVRWDHSWMIKVWAEFFECSEKLISNKFPWIRLFVLLQVPRYIPEPK
jgi:hypothetical protein